MENISNKTANKLFIINKIREKMKTDNIDAYIITGFDPHISEYPEERYRMREILLGFSGSAGTAIITKDKIRLWTDSRYHIQAEEEAKSQPELNIEIFKEGLPDVPDFLSWIINENGKGNIHSVGTDGNTLSCEMKETWEKSFITQSIPFKTECDFLADFLPEKQNPQTMWILPEKYSGIPATEKIESVLIKMEENRPELKVLFISSPHEICWLLNIRGRDIPYNPVIISYLWIEKDRKILFINTEKIPLELMGYFENLNIIIADYNSLDNFLTTMDHNGLTLNSTSKNIGINSQTLNVKTAKLLKKIGTLIPENTIEKMKAVKNSFEIENIKIIMEKEANVFNRFNFWFDKIIKSDQPVNEADCARKLLELRKTYPSFIEESFPTISGFNKNGAIVHYATPENNSASITGQGLLLIDSGAHYKEGTTDITRTFYTGDNNSNIPEKFKKYYTAVLKGHIALATVKFPKGTKGYQLDCLARKSLWKIGANYGHGTGHGVGFCLSVHEGPQRISPRPDEIVLEPGMVISNEPGYYLEGEFGIRIENLLLCIESSDYPGFLEFENLTLAPFETKLINWDELDSEEIKWLRDYEEKIKKVLE